MAAQGASSRPAWACVAALAVQLAIGTNAGAGAGAGTGASASTGAGTGTGTGTGTKPNVLFMVIDDLGFNDLGWSQILHGFSKPATLTPTIDQMASTSPCLVLAPRGLHVHVAWMTMCAREPQDRPPQPPPR